EPTASFIDAMNAQPANLQLALETVARDLDAAARPGWGADESVAIVAMIFQRYVVSGMAAGAVKG
ncbi:MAG: hypothetical protein J0I18_22390, partial [Actinobacteria bacterium]|nr:hypothetical protein [Actinomycetota bacterium]